MALMLSFSWLCRWYFAQQGLQFDLDSPPGSLKNCLVRGLGYFAESTVMEEWVEFQKRGLPHIHILIILADEDRPKTPDQVDNIVSAELPPDPAERGISEDEKARRKPLWDIVLTNMIHGPCGALNPNCPCMEN